MRTRLAIVGAFMRRDFTTALSYRLPYVFDLFAVLVNVVMFFYIGKLIDPAVEADTAELADGYFPFVLVGLSLFGVANVGLSRFSTGIREEQMGGTLEVLLTQPVSSRLVILGSAIYELARAVVTGIVTLMIGIVAFDVDLTTEVLPLLVAAAGFLAAVVLFAAIGIAVAGFTVIFKQAQTVVAVAVLTISLLSGVYYPLEVLPPVLQTIGGLLPTTWALEVLRETLLLGEVDLLGLAGLAAAACVALPAALWLFGLALDRARSLGTLGQY